MEASRRKAKETREKNFGKDVWSDMGKKAKTRTFNDPEVARKAIMKRWYNEDGSRKEL